MENCTDTPDYHHYDSFSETEISITDFLDFEASHPVSQHQLPVVDTCKQKPQTATPGTPTYEVSFTAANFSFSDREHELHESSFSDSDFLSFESSLCATRPSSELNKTAIIPQLSLQEHFLQPNSGKLSKLESNHAEPPSTVDQEANTTSIEAIASAALEKNVTLNPPGILRKRPIPDCVPFKASWLDERSGEIQSVHIRDWTVIPGIEELRQMEPYDMYMSILFCILKHDRIKLARFLKRESSGCDDDIDVLYDTWAQEEVIISQREEAHLVRPSGRLDAPMGILMHYPTFVSDDVNNGKALDPTNPCTTMIVAKMPEEKDFLFLDMFMRREKNLSKRERGCAHTPMTTTWPMELYQHHLYFSLDLLERSTAKAWVMTGKHVQETWRLTELPKSVSWANEDFTVYEHESPHATINRLSFKRFHMPTSNSDFDMVVIYDGSGEIQKILFFAEHPESLKYINPKKTSINKGSRLDDAFNFAAAITNAAVDWRYGEKLYVKSCINRDIDIPEHTDALLFDPMSREGKAVARRLEAFKTGSLRNPLATKTFSWFKNTELYDLRAKHRGRRGFVKDRKTETPIAWRSVSNTGRNQTVKRPSSGLATSTSAQFEDVQREFAPNTSRLEPAGATLTAAGGPRIQMPDFAKSISPGEKVKAVSFEAEVAEDTRDIISIDSSESENESDSDIVRAADTPLVRKVTTSSQTEITKLLPNRTKWPGPRGSPAQILIRMVSVEIPRPDKFTWEEIPDTVLDHLTELGIHSEADTVRLREELPGASLIACLHREIRRREAKPDAKAGPKPVDVSRPKLAEIPQAKFVRPCLPESAEARFSQPVSMTNPFLAPVEAATKPLIPDDGVIRMTPRQDLVTKKSRAGSKYHHLFHYSDGSPGEPTQVLSYCPFCKTKRLDNIPDYDSKGNYVTRAAVCHGCPIGNNDRPMEVHFRPCDPELPRIKLGLVTRRFQDSIRPRRRPEREKKKSIKDAGGTQAPIVDRSPRKKRRGKKAQSILIYSDGSGEESETSNM